MKKSMKWEKLGLVYEVDRSMAKMATVPTPYIVDNEIIRVFFGLCDLNMISRPHYIDLDARDPVKVIGRSSMPLIADHSGNDDTFDQHGIVPTCILPLPGGALLMYYSAFQRGGGVRYRILSGAAISRDNGLTFERVLENPVLGVTDQESMFRCAPFVVRDKNYYRMWYIAGSTWEIVDGKEVPRYVLKYSESDDPLSWPSQGRVCIDLADDEHGFGRPWIIRNEECYRLFYSIRRRSFGAYRLGYAESADGQHWDREDDMLGLEPTPGTFDAQAMSYAAPITINGKTFCFYNGNDFGADGFAVAELIL
jgi:hypothetical protein